MSFLKLDNENKRLFLQLQAFQSDIQLDIAGELLGLNNFRIPSVNFNLVDIEKLDVPNNLRLGNRLEYFFSFIINSSKKYRVLAENIQIIDNKRTLGEIDFILKDQTTDRVLHVELAGKIYLYNPDIEGELARWVGPNQKDALLNKVKKLKEKQFPILYNDTSRFVLKELGVDVDLIEQQICFKARLFLPFKTKETLPKYVANKHIKGYYMNLQEFEKFKDKENRYFLPRKQNWILSPGYGENWYVYKEIIDNIKDAIFQKQSPLVWIKRPDDTYESIFVVWW